MKRFAIAVFTMLALMTPAFAQSDDAVQQSDHVAVSVGRHGALGEGLKVGPNFVEKVARHCANYAQEQRYGFLHLRKHVVVDAEACAADPTTVFWRETTHNLLTNAGKDVIASAVSNTATQAAACNYIALTNTAITPAVGDTTLSGEIASNGLSRAQATYAHTGGTSTYTLVKTFTATATQASQAAGVFNASSSGSMCFENTYTQVTLNNTDTLTVTWTITLS
jgi:hypothetical protein